VSELIPFEVRIPDVDLFDLRERLRRARWPEEVRDAGWDLGVPLGWLQSVTADWANVFDWRAFEARINALPNYLIDLDGFRLHLIRVGSRRETSTPLLMLHGWPSSFVEYLEIVPLLADAGFEVIVPSLPGYGFSEIPLEWGFTSARIAEVMLALMDALGHERFMIHAHDHGASVTSRLAFHHPERVLAYHTTEPAIARAPVTVDSPDLSDAERAFLTYAEAWSAEDSGYAAVQSTKPQTIAYGLNDSPVGLAAWLLEKWHTWTASPTGNLFDAVDRDLVLGNLSVYWFTQTVNYGGRAYFDNNHYLEPLPADATIDVPLGVTLVATQGIERAPRELVARRYPDIRYWHELSRGGHFIAGEEPEILADSLTAFARQLDLIPERNG